MTHMFCVSDEDGNTANFGDRFTENLYVDVWGRGTVSITVNDKDIVVDIFPFHVVDKPIATCCATMDMLVQEEE